MEREQARVLMEAVETAPPAATSPTRAPAEPASLRGIPVVGRRVGGAVFGTQPLSETLRRENRREWNASKTQI